MTQKKLKGIALAFLAAVVVAVVALGFKGNAGVVKADDVEYKTWEGYSWEWDDYGRYFQNSETKAYLANGWFQIGYRWYYFDGDGYVSDDFHNGYPASGYFYDAEGNYCAYEVDTENVPVYSWHKNDKGWWYGTEDGSQYLSYNRKDEDGYYHGDDGLYRIDGVTYGFDSQGYLVKGGWQWLDYRDSDGVWSYDWYYANDDGTVRTGWQKIDGKWYYFSWPHGYMNAGNEKRGTDATYTIDDVAYSFKPDGSLIQNGWVYNWSWIDEDANQYFNYWRYTDSNGTYIWNSWKQINGKWFYFDYYGYMNCSFTTTTGKQIDVYRQGYYLDNNGVCSDKTYTWHQDGDKWWYGDNGFYEKSAWAIIDNIAYYFDADGYIVDDLTVNLEERWATPEKYYFADMTDWVWYFVDGWAHDYAEDYLEYLASETEDVTSAAVVEEAPAEEAPVEEATEAVVEEATEEVVEEVPVEEAPVEEVPVEEVPAE